MNSFRVVRAATIAVALSMLPVSAHAETLREALASAYKNNPNIMSALLSVKSTAEGIALAKSGKLPTIALSGDVGGSFAAGPGSETLYGEGFHTDYNYSAGASYNQTLFDNFKTDAQIEQARALTEVSKYSLRNAEQNVLLSVVQAYFGVIRDTQLVQLRQENIAFFDAQVNSASDRLRLGEGTKIDVVAGQDAPGQARRILQGGHRVAADQPGELSALGRPQAQEPDRRLQLRQAAAHLDRQRYRLGRGPPSGASVRPRRHPRRSGRLRCGRGRLRPDAEPDRFALRHRLLRRQFRPA